MSAALQKPILPRHSVLMQPTTIMNLTDQWISTGSVTLLIKALWQSATDMDMDEDAEMLVLMFNSLSTTVTNYPTPLQGR
jgi:hypothetical protein